MKKEDIEFDEDGIRSTKEGLKKLIIACEKAIKDGYYICDDFTYQLVIDTVDKSFFEREYKESIKDKIIGFFIMFAIIAPYFVGFITILHYIAKLF